ncbi:MAG TPA: DUF1330 domain-containing protein [Alphaproteobacteria bacterium]|nr:DUF1330 domain-containing protein [Alphaproteobacteria bacterium]
MAVYLIAQVDISDMDVFMDYQDKAKVTIENAGGKMLVRNAVPEAVEGSTDDRKIVMIEFPSAQVAGTWFKSPEYQEVAKIREGKAVVEAVMVQGL